MSGLIVRPKTLNEFIGKENIKKALSTYIKSTLARSSLLDHILFYGFPGVGKTSLATIIANELNTKIHYIQGPSITKISDVLDLVTTIQEGDVVFIDEIHQVSNKCLEMLYSILEDFVADIKIGKEFNSQFTRLEVPKFTMICSTTNIGKLPIPFIDRFGIKFFIDLYNENDLLNIIENITNQYNITINNNEKEIIAKSSKGTPRIAINLTKRFCDYRIINDNISCDEIFHSIGVYKYGLNNVDINYLKILYKNKNCSTGIRTIAQQLFLDQTTIENTIEPYLLRCNLIIKKNNGRALTEGGLFYCDHLKFTNSNS